MSYVKIEHRHLGDDRWLDLSPDAFTVHVWALDHCNTQATDGEIPRARALRLVCPVVPADLPAAWQQLVDAGLWHEQDDAYVCPEFTAHGITADEQDATRAKWAADKRRQRLHQIGNHQLCTPRSCKAAEGLSTSSGKSTGGLPDVSPPVHPETSGRLDPTRPDPTPKGSGKGTGALPRADAQAAPPGGDEHHAELRFACTSPAALVNHFRDAIAAVRERHGCGMCRITTDGTEVVVHVQHAIADAWHERITNAITQEAA